MAELPGGTPWRHSACSRPTATRDADVWLPRVFLLSNRRASRNAVAMPDRPFPAVEALIRRVQRIAASRPDPMHILAQTISMTGAIGADPYAVLGVLVEGAVLTIVQHIPAEQQKETAATLVRLLKERLKVRGVPGGDR